LLVTAMAIAVAVVACNRRALGVFLDLPEPEPGAEATLDPALGDTSLSQAVADTLRPEIESVANPDTVIAILPKDNAGNIDWVTALRGGVIRPRAAPPGQERKPSTEGFGFDFVYEAETATFETYFPHSAHVEWLGCESCHPAIFPYRNAAITMQAINGGEACGECHGPVAFSAATCERCHRNMELPAGRMSPELIGDIVFERSANMGFDLPPARFPHWSHRIRYQSKPGHPSPFEMESGANVVTMAMISEGESCGACHNGTDAFAGGFGECNLCHAPEPTASPGE
jgi:c(7)-type cytochrome triheme protein